MALCRGGWSSCTFVAERPNPERQTGAAWLPKVVEQTVTRGSNGQQRVAERPARHIGWVCSGLAQFEGRATSFLAQGFDRRERLVYVADDPVVSQWPKDLVNQGQLLICSTAEIYGVDRIVDAEGQQRRCSFMLAEALRHGFTGMRVAADHTSLITTAERLSAWLRWESEADRFMDGKPVSQLCAFDSTRAKRKDVEAVISVHRVIAPPFS